MHVSIILLSFTMLVCVTPHSTDNASDFLSNSTLSFLTAYLKVKLLCLEKEKLKPIYDSVYSKPSLLHIRVYLLSAVD